MIKCPKCGEPNPYGTVFCKKCGSKFPKELSKQKPGVTGSEIAVGGGLLAAGSSMAVFGGLVMLFIGFILSITLVGAIIGIPMIIAGIVLIGGGLVGFLGGIGAIIGGGIKGVADKLKEREQVTKRGMKPKPKQKIDWALIGLVILGVILLPVLLIGIIPLFFAYRRWKRKR